MSVKIKTKGVPTAWRLQKQNKYKSSHILDVFWNYDSKTYINLDTWAYMYKHKKFQQTACKKKKV